MSRRHARYGAERRPRRVAVFSLAALAVLGAAAWVAPAVLVLTSLRDRPLEAACAGIAGSVSSRSARWHWLGPVEYRDVVIRDAAGRAVVLVPELTVDRGLLGLVVDPRDLGTVRLVGPEAVVEVRADGSSLEDIVAPWVAAVPGSVPACTVEIVDGVVDLVDLPRGDTWRVGDLFAAVTFESGGAVTGWTAGGRVRHAGRAAEGAAPQTAGPALQPTRRPDRSTVSAGAAAALAHEGGFSCASAAAGPGGPRTVAVAAHRLPLGATSVAATRFGWSHVIDGLAEARLDVEIANGSARIEGAVEAARLAVCRADSLAEVLAVDAVEIPVEVVVTDGRLTARKLAAVSPLFRAEASGSIRLPDGTAGDWLAGLVDDDFAVAADVDLSAVSRALAGGIVVRDDVRVTDGHLEIAAAARADGDGRVLEIRAAARDLAAEQAVVAAETGGRSTRPLRWTEPFTTWLKARRGPAGGVRIDEARLTSAALEVTASGDAEAAAVRWSLDLGTLAAGAAEVVDLAGATLAGTSRGRLELVRDTATGPSRVTLAADLEDFEWAVAGRPAWKDEALSVEAEATGRLAAGAAVLEHVHVVVAGGDDRLEGTLAGGAIVDLAGLAAGAGAIRPTPSAAAAADVSLAGDLGRWQARLAALVPAVAGGGAEVSGRVKAAAAVVARGDAWEVTRAAGEVERLGLAVGTTRISEPRLVASAAGLLRPAESRIDVASAEVLTATLSVRTAGLAWRPADSGRGWPDRLRGKLQWQADVGRLERWLMPPEACGRWPATGRAWGTLELADGRDGVDVIVEATGSQLALAEVVAPPPAPPRPVWTEPQATVALEFTVPRSAPSEARIERLSLESSGLVVAARGGLGGTPRAFAIDGTLSYDLGRVSQLLAPWTGGLVNLSGSGGRPFAVRGRLDDAAMPPAAGPAADVATLPLPDDWLAATRAGTGADAAARVARPVAAATRRSAADLVRGVSLDTSIAWQAGAVAGFRLDAGEIPVRLLEGQLAFGPFDVGVSGGRLRGAPWVSLAGAPRELVVPAGRALERVAIGDAQARRLVAWLSPLVGHSTHTSGFVTADLAGARLPLADPFAGIAEAQVAFEELEVTPAGGLAPLANLVAKLQAAVDPRLAFGDRPVLMRVRPDPVRVRLVERRLWHEGLVLDAGQFAVRSAGSVGADGTLAMVVEVALRGDVAGQTPVVAQLLRTPLAIPLTGTVERPQFDARAIDTTLARIVENTAQAVIGDGIVRGLDALLGGQQAPAPAPAPGPLLLPPSQ